MQRVDGETEDAELVGRLRDAATERQTFVSRINVAEIEQRLVQRRRGRRILRGGVAVAAVAAVAMLTFAGIRPIATIDNTEQRASSISDTLTVVGPLSADTTSNIEEVSVVFTEDDIQYRKTIVETKLATWKLEDQIRHREMEIAKLIAAKAEQDFLLTRIDQ